MKFSSLMLACTRRYCTGNTAFDYAVKVRARMVNSTVSSPAPKSQPTTATVVKNPIDKKDGNVLPNKLTWSFANLTDEEKVDFLAKNVVWDKYDIVAINKPYNVCCQDGNLPHGAINLLVHLPALAARLRCSHLHLVHRLDRTSTGVLLLAKTERQAQHLKHCFKERQIAKYYYCITRDVPSPAEGVVDIPITLSAPHSDGKRRVALRPKASELAAALVATPTDRLPSPLSPTWHEAVTQYRVVDQFERSALVEVQPQTGGRHQIRVHLGFALNTPVLGDHKYSSMRGQLMPQRLPECTLERLGVRPARARDLPIFLHAQRVEVPVDPADATAVSVIKAPFPYRFVRAMRQLNLRLPFKLMRSDYI